MANVETTITSILDIFPKLKRRAFRKYTTIAIICIVYFLLGVIFTFQSGTYWIGLYSNLKSKFKIKI